MSRIIRGSAPRTAPAGSRARRDRRLGDSQRHHQPAHRVGPEVRQPGVRAQAHRVLGPAFPDRLVEPDRVGHPAVGDAGVHQHPQPLLERGRRERHHHPARAEEVGEPHILDRSSSTTSTGRRMIADAGRLERGDLLLGGAGRAGDDRAGVAHAAARGRGLPGDEADDRLRHVLLHERRGVLLVGAADLAHHHDGVGLGILLERARGSR